LLLYIPGCFARTSVPPHPRFYADSDVPLVY